LAQVVFLKKVIATEGTENTEKKAKKVYQGIQGAEYLWVSWDQAFGRPAVFGCKRALMSYRYQFKKALSSKHETNSNHKTPKF
jgi:hypothetical protein